MYEPGEWYLNTDELYLKIWYRVHGYIIGRIEHHTDDNYIKLTVKWLSTSVRPKTICEEGLPSPEAAQRKAEAYMTVVAANECTQWPDAPQDIRDCYPELAWWNFDDHRVHRRWGWINGLVYKAEEYDGPWEWQVTWIDSRDVAPERRCIMGQAPTEQEACSSADLVIADVSCRYTTMWPLVVKGT